MNQKGFVPLLIVSLVAILVGGYVLYSKQKSSNPPALQPTPQASSSAEMANWKTYTNSTFKYQLKYPNSYAVVPQTDKQKSQLGVDQNVCLNKEGLEVCKLLINVFSLNNYKLIDNTGGFIFYFDVNKRQWLHDKTNETSQFIPKRANSSFEAYIYKTGDVKCSTELILIPNSNYKSLVEIHNTICRDDEGNLLEGYNDISSDQILSTFKLLP